MPRIFVAVPIPAGVTAALAAALPSLAGLRPVSADHMHVTLAFVGHVAEEAVAAAVAATEAAARTAAPFEVRFGRLGRFPDHGPPRVVWAAAADRGDLDRLAAAVRAELGDRHVPFDEKPFRAHVTLARVGDAASADERRAIDAALRAATLGEDVAFRAAGVSVIESRLSRSGPRYSARREIPLGGATR